MHHACCQFVPPHILDHLARTTSAEDAQPSAAQRSAVVSKQLRDARRRSPLELATVTAPRPGKSDRQVYDCQGTWDNDLALVRGEDDPAAALEGANLAFDHAGATRDFYGVVLGRQSIDGQGGQIRVNVNYGVDFDNAFWDGTRIVMGTGDGKIFIDFTRSPDVMGHELTHGVVQYTANLDYTGQSGALNEHFADVFGSLVEQRMRGEDAGTANWLIGDEVMAPDLYGEALRSMAHPGTAYDNQTLGKDPQPAHLKDAYTGTADNGGVHINSGIPNRAFYLAALELGTDGAGAIWYAGLQNLWPSATFSDAATVLSAQARDGKVERQAAQTVRSAFREVGIG
jgi:Zn-dependent metalloprotease